MVAFNALQVDPVGPMPTATAGLTLQRVVSGCFVGN